MGDFSALALPSVRVEVLRELLEQRGLSWEEANHVAATTSLTRRIRDWGGLVHPVATLVDLAVMPSLPADLALSLDAFPAPDRRQHYEDAIRDWQARATGRRIRMGIQFDQALRSHVRQHATQTPEARALVMGRREFAKSVHTMIAAGLEPRHFDPKTTLGNLGKEVWSHAEAVVPGLTTSRDILWADPDEVRSESTDWGRTVRRRILGALDAAYGPVEGRRVVVHHGFYFFTPPQWAFFQLLRSIPEVDQLFIVHDDGANPVFETWRRFFDPIWSMPRVTRLSAEEGVTPYAAAFRGALSGQTVVDADLERLRVLEFASPAKMVREWSAEDMNSTTPVRFAADASRVERFARRLGGAAQGAPSLAQLPVGAFLLGLHDCIRAVPGKTAEVALKWDSLVDIVASGYVGLDEGPSDLWHAVSALRRCEQYFYGCDVGADWRRRAEQLVGAIKNDVAPLGGRVPGQNDADRIERAVGNPLRTVPWADLSLKEALYVQAAIERVVTFAESLVEHETVRIGAHIGFVRKQVERGMASMDEGERAKILAKLNGFSVGFDDKIDAEGLTDVVSMLLGRDAEFDALGEETRETQRIQELRALDALGLVPAGRHVHIANLSDSDFPSRRGAQRVWPFDYDTLRPMDEGGPDDLVAGLLQLRESTTSLSDLYLMWLALDGASATDGLTLSWISKLDGEKRSLSPLVGLLTTPKLPSEHIRRAVGGVAVEIASTALLGDASSILPVATADRSVQGADLQRIAAQAAASAHACPRRTALQWILGLSAAFGADYLQEMLYGNVLNALVRMGLTSNPLTAARTANVLWDYLTPGQRESSLAKSVVKSSGRHSAHESWILTLDGAQTRDDPLSKAYQAARSRDQPPSETLLQGASGFLPEGVDDPKICMKCPVQSRCLARTGPE